jgi:hypothetical protein
MGAAKLAATAMLVDAGQAAAGSARAAAAISNVLIVRFPTIPPFSKGILAQPIQRSR